MNDQLPEVWQDLTHEQKNYELYLKQKALFDQFLSTGAISQAQHDKSLHDLKGKNGGANRKMGESE